MFLYFCPLLCECMCVFVCVCVCVQGKVGNITFNIFIEDEWDRIETGKDLINKFNSTFLFSKKEELEMLAEIFRIIGKRDLQLGVKSFFGQSIYFQNAFWVGPHSKVIFLKKFIFFMKDYLFPLVYFQEIRIAFKVIQKRVTLCWQSH